jgi:hypothetical protein
MGKGSESTSELPANYCKGVLSILKRQEDCKEDSEEDGEEERRNRISNLVVQFSDLVNADRTSWTTATMSIEELCQSVKSGNSQQYGGSDKEEGDEPPFPMFGEAVSRFEVYKGYLRFYKTHENT